MSADSSIARKLAKAISNYQNQNLQESKKLCRDILQKDRQNIVALHLAGVIEAQQGNPTKALEFPDQALRVNPSVPDVLADKGKILIELEHFEDALSCCQKAFALDPNNWIALHNQGCISLKLGRNQEALGVFDKLLGIVKDFPPALNNRGVALKNLNRFVEAALSFEKSVSLDPMDFEKWSNLGEVLFKQQNYPGATTAYDKAISLKPDLVEAWLGRGNIFADLQQYDEAFAAYDKALALRPDLAEAWLGRGNALTDRKRHDEALVAYDKALDLKPNLLGAWIGRGRAFTGLRRYDEAATAYEKALAFDPDFAPAWHGRGDVHFALNQDGEALRCFDKAIALSGDLAGAHWNKALLKLSLGEYDEGWKLYEWRWKARNLTPPSKRFSQPLWLGDADLTGTTVLIHSEQGFGDTIQFFRYLPLLKDLKCKVLFETRKPLAPLLRDQDADLTVTSEGEMLEPFDFQCPLLSLPFAFKTTMKTIPAAIPYLRADRDKVRAWENRLQGKTRLKIGAVWSGNPNFQNDFRPIPLKTLLPIMTEAADWYSLQKDVRDTDRDDLSGSSVIQDVSESLSDFAQTAAAITALDLVISIDTAVAHLAGALGKPVWVLLPFHPDFRWLRDRDDSPWYPTARLFRQTTDGDWNDVLARVSKELRGFTPR